MKTMISASILSADMLHLGDVIEQLAEAGTDMLHFDVMDGVLVPNISFGLPVLEAISDKTSLFLDVHLMITDPIRYVEKFAAAGADLITFHLESTHDPAAVIDAIHKAGCRAGISVKPATPARAVFPYLDAIDCVLVMTVEPGFGGQGYIHAMTEKIQEIHAAIQRQKKEIWLEADGGVNDVTAPLACRAGADILVVGSYLFRHPCKKNVVADLQSCLQEGILY